MRFLLLSYLLTASSCFAYEDIGPEDFHPEPRAIFSVGSEQSCVAIDKFGCWYAPGTIHNSNAPTLLVFFRGWRNDQERSNVPSAQRVDSARQAFIQFGLDDLARAKNVGVIVTGAPPLSVNVSQVQQVEAALGVHFSRVFLASHSAGYQGLDATLTLGTFTGIQRIVMLDTFYMEGTLLDSVTDWVDRGTACNGFYTYDRRDSIRRHQAAFKRVCRLEDHNDTGHFETINKCLGNYLEGQACP